MRIRKCLAVVGILRVVSLCACGGSIQSSFGRKEERRTQDDVGDFDLGKRAVYRLL